MKLLSLSFFALLTSFACAFPSQTEIKQAASVVGDLVADDIKAANSGKAERGKVAEKMLGYVDVAETDAAKWLLLKHAFIQYAKAADYPGAAETMTRILKDFKDVPPAMALSLIEGSAGKASAKNAPDLMAIKMWLKVQSRCADVLKSKKATKLQKAEATCLMGDWERGLRLLSALDGTVGKIATGEKSGSMSIKDVADFWWEYKCNLDTCGLFKVHAVELYRSGITSGTLSGLHKSVAEKRIAESDTFEIKTDWLNKLKIPSSGLIHRWSFSGSLKDSVGKCDGKVEGGSVKFADGQVRIEPGSGYVSLGADLFPVKGDPFTLEVWSTCHKVIDWARVFQVGTNWGEADWYWMWSAKGDARLWEWKVAGCVRWTRRQGDGLAPDKEHHFYVVCDRNAEGKNFYHLGVYRGKNLYWSRAIEVQGSVFHAERFFWLGHSQSAHDSNADASYDEVRIWNRALTSEELNLSAAAGPDALPAIKPARSFR